MSMSMVRLAARTASIRQPTLRLRAFRKTPSAERTMRSTAGGVLVVGIVGGVEGVYDRTDEVFQQQKQNGEGWFKAGLHTVLYSAASFVGLVDIEEAACGTDIRGEKLTPGERVKRGFMGLLSGALTLFGGEIARGRSNAVGKAGKVSAATSKMEQVRKAGIEGEKAAGIAKNTQRIESITGKAAYRIPDELTATCLKEVKNVSIDSRTLNASFGSLSPLTVYDGQTVRIT